MTSLMSTVALRGSVFVASWRIRWITSAARRPSFTMASSASRTISSSGVAPANQLSDALAPVISSDDGDAIRGALEHLPGEILRPLPLGDVRNGHEHAVEPSGRVWERDREQRGQRISLQALENGLGLEGRPPLRDGDQLAQKDLSGLWHEDFVQ